jgi:ribosomal protein S18 acetylase RimI-like enzyme
MVKDATVRVRELDDGDAAWKQDALRRAWGDTVVARQGEVVDAMALDGFVALVGGERVGLLTYAHRDDGVEVVTVQAERDGAGIGRALMTAVCRRAESLGARRLWLVTTNANVRAIGFYQRFGMNLVALHRDAVTRARALKPGIPLEIDGIGVRHELELELRLDAQSS